MKYMLFLIVSISFLSTSYAADAPTAKQEIRFLFVGNSYSFRVAPHVEAFFKSSKSPYTSFARVSGDGGAAIEGSYQLTSRNWIPSRGKFDYIILQEQSDKSPRVYRDLLKKYPKEMKRGDSWVDIYNNNKTAFEVARFATYTGFIQTYKRYFDLIKNKSPGDPTILAYQSWGIINRNYTINSRSGDFFVANREYAENLATYAKHEELPSGVLHAGDAFQYLMENGKYVTLQDLYDLDGSHPGLGGQFLIAALLVQQALDDRNSEFTLSDFDYTPKGLSIEKREELIVAAQRFSTRKAPKVSHKITFINVDGTKTVQTVLNGKVATPPKGVNITGRVFLTWPEVSTATKDATYKAIARYKWWTITFVNVDGSRTYKTLRHGSTVTPPQAINTTDRTFSSWPVITTATDAAVYKASYTINTHQTNFVNTGEYELDSLFSGGDRYFTQASIDTANVGDVDPAIYQSERWGNFSYVVEDLQPQINYTIRLHFAEIYWNAPGQRVFDVTANNIVLLHDFDIFAEAGGRNIALVRQFNIEADANGLITLDFSASVNFAKVSAIEVLAPVLINQN